MPQEQLRISAVQPAKSQESRGNTSSQNSRRIAELELELSNSSCNMSGAGFNAFQKEPGKDVKGQKAPTPWRPARGMPFEPPLASPFGHESTWHRSRSNSSHLITHQNGHELTPGTSPKRPSNIFTILSLYYHYNIITILYVVEILALY